MVLRFEEFIKEGLWSSGMKRAENNDYRQEDVVEHIFNDVFKKFHKGGELNFNYVSKDGKTANIPIEFDWFEYVDEMYEKLSKIHMCTDITSEFNENSVNPSRLTHYIMRTVEDGEHCIVYVDKDKRTLKIVGERPEKYAKDYDFYVITRSYHDYEYEFVNKSGSVFKRKNLPGLQLFKPCAWAFLMPQEVQRLLYEENKK